MSNNDSSDVSISTVDLDKYRQLGTEEKKNKVKQMLEKMMEQSLDEMSRDIPPEEREYLNG